MTEWIAERMGMDWLDTYAEMSQVRADEIMALSEFELRKIEKACEAFLEKRRPPESIRSELDLGYRVRDQHVEIFEIRPSRRDPSSRNELPVAKATWVKTRQYWKIYWMRADLKWHGYPPKPTVFTVEEFLAEVDADPYCCFFG